MSDTSDTSNTSDTSDTGKERTLGGPGGAEGCGGTLIISDGGGHLRRQVDQYRLVGPGVDRCISAPALRLGSHPSNDLILADASVSRLHATIEAGPAGYTLRDLDSTNGSWIEGVRVQRAYLPPRALLRFGQSTLHFTLTGEKSTLAGSDQEEFHGVIGRSPAMRELFAVLARVAPTDATILLEGESGTGKELVTSAIHRASRRATGPLVVFDCAAMPAPLVESELFGHERGAFTGAATRYQGQVREADGGTLFLDEIGELPRELQPKLLRVLETRQVRPLGSNTTYPVDLRLVAATNRDLAREVNRGNFREDLYYRLAVVQLKLPPLRERQGDLPLLVRRFVQRVLEKEPARANELLRGISDEHWRQLELLRWPGNVRELRNFIERTLIISGGPTGATAWPGPLAGEAPGRAALPNAPEATDAVALDRPFAELKAEKVASFERAYLLGQLARHDQNVSAAARAAGLDRMSFKRLLAKYR
ncbi:MAG: sigma 54-dependent Fis family transcriptional regulator [Proteobacteria bacterium]|nr:sigma 54-dependent Fis family transcriptional regulator [Pseudomonadota bacterium]